MRIGSLFSGIGGLDLGIEYATDGDVAWMCEKNGFCQRVLARHWPTVPIYDDIETLDVHDLTPVDMVVGGFPCQDISALGGKDGLDGSKSGLWRHYARVVRDLRPRYVFVENVADLAVRGLDRVLADLAAFGFDAEWTSLRACDVGAPHLRRRLFLFAWRPEDPVADAYGIGRPQQPQARLHRSGQHGDDADGRHAWILRGRFPPGISERGAWACYQADAGPEPGLLRGADGLATSLDVARVRDRLRAIGNAVMPRQGARAFELLTARAGLSHLTICTIPPILEAP